MVEIKTLKENNSSFNYKKLFCIKDNVVIDIQQKNEMQEKYDPLKLFNFCSFLFGISISVRNQSRLVRVVHLILFIICSINIALNSVDTLYFYKSASTILWLLRRIYFNSGAAFYCLFIHLFGNKIYQTINNLIKNLTFDQKKRIKLITTIGCVIIITERIAINAYGYILEVEKNGFSFKRLIFELFLLIRPNYIFHSFLVYTVFQMAFFYSCINLLNELESCLNPSPKLIMKTVVEIYQNLNSLNMFAVIPFSILLPYLFIILPGCAQTKNQSVIYLLFIFTVMYCSCFIVAVVTATVFKRKLQTKRNQFIQTLFSKKEHMKFRSIEWTICLDQLSDKNMFNFSVLSLFSIDFSLLMSVSSAVITFSILFFQLDSAHNSL